ncbi:tRNA methyltransferase complex GCD14 subunit family protein [Cryptosporidium meleagridis]|uniref:tRNA (adenine(58)-N(1))-methyltransferase n=1 Tax=Cryptosporidium meleagridis TaxID=93969 RepID=A0A2P4Z335_9CRYT|nr:tRNA methyltransferase complex GCD14 subunit family protein [Cryptosporidium meleagridis]
MKEEDEGIPEPTNLENVSVSLEDLEENFEGSNTVNKSYTKRRCYEKCKDGDLVILFGGYEMVIQVFLEQNGRTQTRNGVFLHNEIIGKNFGSRIFDTSKSKWMVVLKLSPELISISLHHRTQILYQADISLICVLLDASPGKNIIEAGTGSGSLTVSLCRSTHPGGVVYTFEYDQKRHLESIQDFQKYGISNVVCQHRDVCKDGFISPLLDIEKTNIHGIFLDLPSPWIAIKHADQVLQKGASIVIFSPCIEQVSKNCNELNLLKYIHIRTFEVLYKPWGIVRGSSKKFPTKGLRYQLPMRGHTGYLSFAIKS